MIVVVAPLTISAFVFSSQQIGWIKKAEAVVKKDAARDGAWGTAGVPGPLTM